MVTAVNSVKKPTPIIAVAQNYDWGVKGSASLVAKLHAGNSGASISEDKPYAELWMGCHPSAPSKVNVGDKDITLLEFIGQELPFLFKVLSVGKALSIQAHPDLELAKQLHAKDPVNYKDANHKPEMAIALTEFEALCGFRPIQEIVESIGAVPELSLLVSPEAIDALNASLENSKETQKAALKTFFAEFIASEGDAVMDALRSFEQRLAIINRSTTKLEELCMRLNSQFPGEVGCFCVFIMNYVVMQPGQAIFLAANEPHAYLSGDCVECMALSDNVVRAGLTPKYRDVDTLVAMLTYESYQPEDLFMETTILSGSKHTMSYIPPVKEFAVLATTFDSLGQSDTIKLDSGSDGIIICLEGDLNIQPCSRNDDSEETLFSVSPGGILLLLKACEYQITCNSSQGKAFIAYSQ